MIQTRSLLSLSYLLAFMLFGNIGYSQEMDSTNLEFTVEVKDSMIFFNADQNADFYNYIREKGGFDFKKGIRRGVFIYARIYISCEYNLDGKLQEIRSKTKYSPYNKNLEKWIKEIDKINFKGLPEQTTTVKILFIFHIWEEDALFYFCGILL